jgi:predicted metal-binding protein
MTGLEIGLVAVAAIPEVVRRRRRARAIDAVTLERYRVEQALGQIRRETIQAMFEIERRAREEGVIEGRGREVWRP